MKIVFKILFFVVLILLFFTLVRYFYYSEPLTFYSFLTSLQKMGAEFDFSNFITNFNYLVNEVNVFFGAFRFDGSTTLVRFIESFFIGLPVTSVTSLVTLLYDVSTFVSSFVITLLYWFGFSGSN